MFWQAIARMLATPVALTLLQYLARRPHAVDLGEYMGRWWLFNPSDRPGYIRWLPSIRLHHIRRPDKGRDPHNHPWAFRTFILSGSYREERECGETFNRHPGDTVLVPRGTFHRIAGITGGGCWTLVITYRKRGRWGFMRDGVFVPHEYYEHFERYRGQP